ncbi:hypothetical protein EV207_10485 [Scopulibacillus darangshiensis]|uniref:Transcriptional regulator n=1 Tax=Scopulibacillus darangshiensis TaxID=442528 RepID=A0A4V2SNE3_9BACL|nr:hypothetical protein [Scopulibacillus darangshiensis]TCP30906.1 hypothetical protein EV207_10485 [Scopulibacillus darangshiensis]
MVFKIGVIGPQLSVERILDIAKEFELEMAFNSYPYTKPTETEELIKQNKHGIDAWLFSGPIPYEIAKNSLGEEEDLDLVLISPTETGIYKGLVDLAYQTGSLLESISIDIPFSVDLVDHALNQLEKPPSHVYMKTFDVHINPEELFQTHLKLWEEGKVQGVLTTYSSVNEDLKKMGIPSHWITTSRLETRQTLQILAEKVRASYFKDTQIGVEIIEVEQFDRIIEKAKSPYHLQYLELRLKEMLLQFCERMDGSLLEKGNGRYVIICSRGAVEREMGVLQSTVDQLSLETDSPVSVGIGFGETVFSAESNARRAIQQSKEKPERGTVIVEDDGKIIESLEQGRRLAYSPRIDDRNLLNKLKKGNISVKTYNKINALITRMGWQDFSTKDLAVQLHMTNRNAQRIIADLCEAGLAESIGEEARYSRGRPNKIYRLK